MNRKKIAMGKREQRYRRGRHSQRVIEDYFVAAKSAAELREAGVDIEAVIVNRRADATGYPVTCGGCGMTGRVPNDPGEGVGFCPACARAAGLTA